MDLKQELESYQPIDLKVIDQNTSDSVKNSIILYNKALESIRVDSEDIAIIELKKAVALNPTFYQAMNLLGLCYYYTDNPDKARDIFNVVIKAENNSIQAQKFLSQLGASSENPYKSSSVKKKPQPAKNKEDKPNDIKNEGTFLKRIQMSGKPQFILYSCSLIIIGVVISLLIGLLINNGSDTTVNSNVSENTQSGAYKQLQDSYNKLNEDFKKTSQQLTDSNAQIDYYKNVSKLQQAQNLAVKGQYAEAANILVPLKDYKFNDSDKTTFDALYKDVTVKAAQYSYNQAFVFMQRSQFKEAADEFNKIQSYVATGWASMDSVLYNLGKCYIALNNTQSAIDVYKKLKADYPNSQYAVWAGNRLTQLGVR